MLGLVDVFFFFLNNVLLILAASTWICREDPLGLEGQSDYCNENTNSK